MAAEPTARTSGASSATRTPTCIILDDFGLKPLPPAGPEDFYEVINERHELGALIVTSNRAFTEWPDLFQSPLLASATLDRIAHHAHQSENGKTMPRRLAPDQPITRGPLRANT